MEQLLQHCSVFVAKQSESVQQKVNRSLDMQIKCRIIVCYYKHVRHVVYKIFELLKQMLPLRIHAQQVVERVVDTELMI